MREDPQLPQVSKDEARVPGDEMHGFNSGILIMCMYNHHAFAFCTETITQNSNYISLKKRQSEQHF